MQPTASPNVSAPNLHSPVVLMNRLTPPSASPVARRNSVRHGGLAIILMMIIIIILYYTQTGIVSSVTVRHYIAVILTIIMLIQFLYYTQTSIVSNVTLSTQCMQAGDAEHRVIPSVERVPKESDGEIRKLQSQIQALKQDVEHHRITVSTMQ